MLDGLCIQIQRSMDFFESQLRQPPVRKVVLHINAAQPEIIVEQISQVVSASVMVMDLNAVVNDPSDSLTNLSSLGMALLPFRAKQVEAKQETADEK